MLAGSNQVSKRSATVRCSNVGCRLWQFGQTWVAVPATWRAAGHVGGHAWDGENPVCRLSGFGVRHAKLRPRSQGLCSHEATAPVSYAAVSMPDWVQYSPNSSAGCGARSEPLPQRLSLTGQYKSQPRHTRSGCWGLGELLGGHDCLALPVAAFWLA